MRISDYQSCLNNSEKVFWDLQEAVSEINLDFSRPFLPEELARTGNVSWLGEQERLLLNQIQGRAYAHIFLFVEEFIVSLIHKLALDHMHGQREALQALMQFCTEEVKHQRLFIAFKEKFDAGFPIQCEEIGSRGLVAEHVMRAHPVAILLLAYKLELITQDHYRSSFSEHGRSVDESFRKMFKLHWLEEAQHTKLDELELKRLVEPMPVSERSAVAKDFFTLADALERLLTSQARLDIASLEAVLGTAFSDEQCAQLETAAAAGYHWQFLGCGLLHESFQEQLLRLQPALADQLAQLVVRYGTDSPDLSES